MKCRCKYPKKTRVGDDARGLRLLYCETHGFSLIKCPLYAQPKGLYLALPDKRLRKKTGLQQGKVSTENQRG